MRSSGRWPDDSRRQLAVGLRDQGLSFRMIGQRLGITRQGAYALVKAGRAGENVCIQCGASVSWASRDHHREDPLLCRDCLAQQPITHFGQRLRLFRLAAGLTQEELAVRTGIAPESVVCYEQSLRMPRPRILALLDRVLGPELARPQERTRPGRTKGTPCVPPIPQRPHARSDQ
jgi:DNA-binding XRE family transcriptional regulator